ncbi:MAG: hypothetical protein H6697_08100 [Myxococcales bacterium]|nr:hypothetical protein [Myxococcales bacterium]
MRVTLTPLAAAGATRDVRGFITAFDASPSGTGLTSREVDLEWSESAAAILVPASMLYLPEGGELYFLLGHRDTSSCGNGVVEDGEQCDEPGSRCIRCHYASPACRDDEWGCHRSCSTIGVDCATEPVGPCEYATCDSNSAECVRWPKLEGEPCVDGEVEGWCRGGVCDPRPEECALCSQGYRLIDGVCQPEEWGYSYVAGRIPSAAVAGYPVTLATPVTVDAGEPAGVIGAGVLDELFGRVVDLRPLIPTGAPDQSLRPGTVWHETMEYRFEGWEGWSTGATLTPYRAIWDEDDELISFDVPRTSGYGTWHWAWPESIARHYFGFEFPGVTFAEFGLYNDHFFASDEGLFYVSRLRQSTSDLGVCEVAVNVDGDWQTCPERPGAAMCDGRCIDTRQSEQHCGQCGNACGDAEICAGGECVCDPRLARLDLPTCAWDACPDGWYGPGCRSACPGILEGEPECYGRGECSDGPFGTGICMCTGGHHGADCMYSCSDGVRNGSEVNVDCGGLRCAPCR